MWTAGCNEWLEEAFRRRRRPPLKRDGGSGEAAWGPRDLMREAEHVAKQWPAAAQVTATQRTCAAFRATPGELRAAYVATSAALTALLRAVRRGHETFAVALTDGLLDGRRSCCGGSSG